jgi:hypothetical protein
LTTAAAIDRVVVHHSLIVEFGRDIKSYRAEEAARRTGIHFDGPTTAQDTAAWDSARAFLDVIDVHF